MSTIKISQLPILQLGANTSNTVFVGVDIPTQTTAQFTATAIAQGLYSNNALVVGKNIITFSNTIGQFSGSDPTYVQLNLQNFNSNGSSDFVLTADNGTNSNSYVDLGINNSTFNPSLYGQTSQYAFDGYLIVQGPGNDGSGNLVMGTAVTNTNILLVSGGLANSNVVASFSQYSANLNIPVNITANTTTPTLLINQYGSGQALVINDSTNDTTLFIVNGDGNTSIGALSSGGYKLLVAGNTYFSGDVGTSGNISIGGLTQTGNINVSNLTVNGTSSLLGSVIVAGNTTISNNITIGGLTQTGNINVSNLTVNGTSNLLGSVTVAGNGYININNSLFSSNTSLVKITASNNYATIAPSNQDYLVQLTGKDGYPTRVILDSFGNGGSSNSYSVIAGRSGRGTAGSPSFTQSGDVLMRIGGSGYSNSGFVGTGSARIDLTAIENFTDSTKGTAINLWTTAPGTNTTNVIATFTGSNVSFTGAIIPQKGMIYTPRTQNANSTIINVDFSNDSVIRATVNTNYTVAFTNYTPGKIVDLWITNLAGTNSTFTPNVAAINSTINSTTYTHQSTSTIYVKYMSFYTDQANTFVSVTHA